MLIRSTFAPLVKSSLLPNWRLMPAAAAVVRTCSASATETLLQTAVSSLSQMLMQQLSLSAMVLDGQLT